MSGAPAVMSASVLARRSWAVNPDAVSTSSVATIRASCSRPSAHIRSISAVGGTASSAGPFASRKMRCAHREKFAMSVAEGMGDDLLREHAFTGGVESPFFAEVLEERYYVLYRN